MRTLLIVAAAATAVLSGCGQGVGAETDQPPGSAGTSPPARPSTAATAQVLEGYTLYTHCGIREARVGDGYYRADPTMDDGNANPPPGWNNPEQRGTMTVRPDGTAVFTAGHLQARFVLRPGATDWLQRCD